jgi:hypothetical protein
MKIKQQVRFEELFHELCPNGDELFSGGKVIEWYEDISPFPGRSITTAGAPSFIERLFGHILVQYFDFG